MHIIEEILQEVEANMIQDVDVMCFFFFSSRRRHTRFDCDWSSDVCSSDLALGIFHAFLDDREVELVGVEAAGEGLTSGRHAASLGRGRPGVFHGSLSYLLQDGDGQVQPAHSVSAGLDYPGVGPEHAYLKDSGRVLYVAVTDQEALAAFAGLSRLEGILPALESAHAVAWVLGRREHWRAGDLVLINLSGRGDKDVAMVAELTGAKV